MVLDMFLIRLAYFASVCRGILAVRKHFNNFGRGLTSLTDHARPSNAGGE